MAGISPITRQMIFYWAQCHPVSFSDFKVRMIKEIDSLWRSIRIERQDKLKEVQNAGKRSSPPHPK